MATLPFVSFKYVLCCEDSEEVPNCGYDSLSGMHKVQRLPEVGRGLPTIHSCKERVPGNPRAQSQTKCTELGTQ